MVRTVNPVPNTSNKHNELTPLERKRLGRPKKPFSYYQLDQLCKIQCSGQECASVLNMSYDALNDRLEKEQGKGFVEYYKEKSAVGKKRLRRVQFELALGGDKSMLIWLGKQYLGQSEKQEISGAAGGPIKTEKTVQLSNLTNEELALLEKVLAK